MQRPRLLFLPSLLCDAALWRRQAAASGDVTECRLGDVGQASVAVGPGGERTASRLAKGMATLTSLAELKIACGAGHRPPLETSDAVSAAFRDWLTSFGYTQAVETQP